MVDVSAKPDSLREAEAAAEIIMRPETVEHILSDAIAKGNVLCVARIAGIQAAKRTAELIPLCHTLPLSAVDVDFETKSDRIAIRAMVRTTAQTGVEMEALTAAATAALTIYDMCKAVDKSMRVDNLHLVRKTKKPRA